MTVVVTESTRPAAEPRDLRESARFVEGRLPPSPSGHLAYVGADDNVYVVDPITGATVQVTDDGSSADTGSGIFHTGMAWSETGELAFARTDVEAFTSSLFVTVPGSGEVRQVTRRSGILIYASWSPAGCDRPRCSRLAYIADAGGEPGGEVTLNVLRPAAATPWRVVLEQRGTQIYFSWAGRRGRLIRHVLDADPTLEEVELDEGSARPIRARLGPFLAPAVAAGRVVYAVATDQRDEPIVTLTKSAVLVHTSPDVRRVAFVPSPDGRRLALAFRHGSRRTPEEAFEHPWIVDLRTGEIERVGPPSLWTEAFYWAPDSRRLAYLTWLDNDLRPYNQWRVFDVQAGRDRGFAAFEPTRTFETLTTFFDQFGQSHRLWSPDGRYLAYAAVSGTGEEQVWLLDTSADRTRILVADGVVASFAPPPRGRE